MSYEAMMWNVWLTGVRANVASHPAIGPALAGLGGRPATFDFVASILSADVTGMASTLQQSCP